MEITNQIRSIRSQLNYRLHGEYINHYYSIFDDYLRHVDNYRDLKRCLKRHNIKESNLQRIDWIEYVKPVFTQDYTQHARCILSVPVGEFEITLEHSDYNESEINIIERLTDTILVRGFAYYTMPDVEFLLDVEQFKKDLRSRELAMWY